jgi:hypothetical protein
VVFSTWLSHRDVLSFGGELGLKEKLHEAEHRFRMRACPGGSGCLDRARVSSQLPKLPNKESRDRRRAERKWFVEHRRELGLLDR